MKKIIFAISAIGILSLAISFVFAQAPTLSVTTDELTTAGFTNPAMQPAASTSFLLPNHYFHVGEAVADSFGWGNGGNLVTVLITPKVNQSWIYNNGQMKTLDMAGKTQVRFTTANYYIVVTGPDSGKVMNLAEALAMTP